MCPYVDLTVRPVVRWDQIIGNEEAKATAISVVRNGGKLFVAGPSGSGKTATIELACKLAVCRRPNANDPCDQCEDCQKWNEGTVDRGLFSYLSNRPDPVHIVKLNCRGITANRLEDELDDLRHAAGLRIVHLEEAAHLWRMKCDFRLTAFMDEPWFRGCRWFATAVNDFELDGQFRRRWTKVPVVRADTAIFVGLLRSICSEFGITVDDDATVKRLAERSHRIVGLAVGPIDLARRLVPSVLTRGMVENYTFPSTDPWGQHPFGT